ncbi:MAG: YafY family protein [Oscillospiraceae bacterium]|nr:YafY family protein [Oscillospiraceae bacterium]
MAQLDRQLGIVTVLLRNRKATARELAERFGVSTRTIRRDIDSICRAGIPLCTMQGASGGVEIMDGYSVDRSVFSYDEIEALIIALRGTDAALGESYTERFIEKLSDRDFAPRTAHALEIDLVDDHASSLSRKLRLFRQAIIDSVTVEISYHNAGGDTLRTVEPYRLLFRWGSWYLFAYCRLRGDFRLFKLQRIGDARVLSETFRPRTEASEPKDWDGCFSGDIRLTAIFDACIRYRLCEEYDPSMLTPTGDGRYLFSFCFTYPEHLVSWLLSFGSRVEILEPAFIRDLVIEEAGALIARNTSETKEVSGIESETRIFSDIENEADTQLSGFGAHNGEKTGG